eukprot:689810-Prorocentrum_minimum.AAC.4
MRQRVGCVSRPYTVAGTYRSPTLSSAALAACQNEAARPNQTQEVQVHSHDGPVRHRKRRWLDKVLTVSSTVSVSSPTNQGPIIPIPLPVQSYSNSTLVRASTASAAAPAAATARVYSQDGPIRRRKRGYILMTDHSSRSREYSTVQCSTVQFSGDGPLVAVEGGFRDAVVRHPDPLDVARAPYHHSRQRLYQRRVRRRLRMWANVGSGGGP